MSYRRVGMPSAFALSLSIMLAGCGGDGSTDVASIPPPPASPTPTPSPSPTPTSTTFDTPLTRVGTHDLIGSLSGTPGSGSVAPGTFSLSVVIPSRGLGIGYRLTGPTGFLPAGLTSVDFEGPFSATTDSVVGSDFATLPFDADKNIRTSLGYDLGYSYVSMGEWNWYFVHPDGGTADGGYGDLVFVSGDRTPSAGIPATGTATYDAHSFALKSSATLQRGIPFSLTADFGQRMISTAINQDYRYDPNGDMMDDPAFAIHVAGSAPFSNAGSFNIPLTGSANYGGNLQTPPPASPVTGNMNGAFFGPHAEQVGGVFQLSGTSGVQVLHDAFIGKQH